MTITYRTIKGAALTYPEMDENLRDLRYDTTLQRVTTNGNTTNNILTVYGLTVTGNLLVTGNIVSNSTTTSFETLNVTNLYVNTIKNNLNDPLVTYTSNSVNVSDDVWDNALFRVNKKTISSSITLSSTYNYSSIGPIEIANGVIVTIANGAVWTIV
jgi:hypothetical protein